VTYQFLQLVSGAPSKILWAGHLYWWWGYI
jgi:hypothetical protein